MKILLSLLIAVRLERGYSKVDKSSIISYISIISIAIGVAVLIIVLSAMNGFVFELNNRILSILPHGKIEPIKYPFNNWQYIIDKIMDIPDIISAEPYLNFIGILERNNKLQTVQIWSINPTKEMYISSIHQYVQYESSQFLHAEQNQIIIGKGIADALKIKLGDWLTVMFANKNSQHKMLQSKYVRLQVIGILVLSNQLDNNLAILPLIDAQKYLYRGDDVDGIAIKVKDIFNINKLLNEIKKVIYDHILTSSWINYYGYIYRDIQMIRAIVYLSMLLVIGLACFNIISIIITKLKDKMIEFAILNTLGASNKLISLIFIWYSLLICLTGSIIGILFGVVISLNLNTLIKGIEYLTDYKFISNSIYFIDFIPTKLNIFDIFSVLMIVIILSLLSSVYPAYCANRVEPARILSGK